jgi:hypothetical protein
MAEPILPEPSPAARELLRAFREHESPSPATREEGFAGLQARLEASEPAPVANGRLYMLKVTLVTVAVAAAVLLAIKGVGAGVTALADDARRQGMEAPYHGETGADGGQAVARGSRGVPPRRAVQATTDAHGPAEPQAATDATALEAAARQPATSDATATTTPASSPAPAEPALREAPSSTPARSPRARPAESTAADDLEAELALITRATEAKKTGRHADGLAALREHAKRFPRGVMAEERTVLKAELLCAAGRGQEADALVEAFLRERAGSALVGRMRNVCRE